MYSIAIEGNIGAGKSTFLEYFSKKYPNRVNVYCEPVHRWRNINNVNLFDLMYKDPKRYGFIFQSYVQLTMLEMHDEIDKIQSEQKNKFKKQLEQSERKEILKQQNEILFKKDRMLIFKDLTNNEVQNNEVKSMKKRLRSNSESDIGLNKKHKSSSINDYQCSKKIVKTNQKFEIDKVNIETELNGSNGLLSYAADKIMKELEPQFQYSVNMMERSIFSARYIFVENLFQNNLLSEIEYKILDETFLFMIKRQKIKIDLIVYLRSTPEQCYKRMIKRSRPEETQTLQLEHFKKFHQLHEDFLIGKNSLLKKVLDIPVLVIDTLDSKEKMFQKIDEHSLFIMKELTSKEPFSLIEV